MYPPERIERDCPTGLSTLGLRTAFAIAEISSCELFNVVLIGKPDLPSEIPAKWFPENAAGVRLLDNRRSAIELVVGNLTAVLSITLLIGRAISRITFDWTVVGADSLSTTTGDDGLSG